MKTVALALACVLFAPLAIAKLPPPPPVDPVKAEEAKQKAAEAAKKGAELQAKYEDKAAENYANKLRASGKEFKPQLGPGLPTPPAPAAPVPTVAAAPTATAPAKAPETAKKP
jgi:hypothetical protein